VIVTNVGGLAENVRNGESGIVIPPRDAGALAGAMRSVLSDRALQQRLASGAASVAKNEMSWERVVDEHLQLYREVAA
jgi:glycosyltransferase involved in cell wall biosynthesis